MGDAQAASRVDTQQVQAMRDIVGGDFSEMDIVYSLHLSRNNVEMAINLLFDTPGFRSKSKSPAKNVGGSSNPPSGKQQVGRQEVARPVEASGRPAAQQVGCAVSELSLNFVQESAASSSCMMLDDTASTPPSKPETELQNDVKLPESQRKVKDVESLPAKLKVAGPGSGKATEKVVKKPSAFEDEELAPRCIDLSDDTDEERSWLGMPDVPDLDDWWLLAETQATGYSTCKGNKISPGDFVSFNFPKPGKAIDVKKRMWNHSEPSSKIVRFYTGKSGEIGRLPADWAKCLIPLVHSNKVALRGKCKSVPSTISLMSSIDLSLRVYINQSFFKKYEGTVSLDESTFRPLPSLMQLLGKTPVKQADFTPEDLNVYTRKSRAEDAPAGKRLKSESNDDDDVDMVDSEVDHVVGTSDTCELKEMDEPEGLECKLRPYQKQALHWMSNLEVGITREDAAKTLHPCWSQYELADSRASGFYVNAFSGEATLDFPSAMQTTRGGILADAMGLGKTVMTISLLLSNRGKGCVTSGQAPSVSRKSQLKGGGTLIVCPMTLLGQWRSELQAHVSSGVFSVYAYYGPDRVRDVRVLARHDIVLTTYGVVQSEHSNSGTDGPIHSVHWFRVVLDEAHTIKASKTTSAQAVFKLVADRRLCLTGTPVQNKLEDLYSLFHFLRVEPWCNWGWWHKLIQKPYEEGDERGLKLLQRILKPLMLRRTKDSTDKEGRPILVLPPAESEVIECELSAIERDFYDALYHKSKVKFDQFVEQGKVLHNYASILELLLRLRQTCDHPFLVLSRGDTDEYADLTKLANRFMKNDGSAPAKFVSEVVEDIRKGETAECPICLEVFEDAVLTPCAHRMCRECLFNSWGNAVGGPCPICRNIFGKKDLITVPTGSRFRINVEENWTESSKVKALFEQLEKTRRAGSKSVVFSQWTAFLDLLEIPLKRGKFQYVRLDGTLAQQKREQVLKDFSSNPSVSLMLISLKAGGVGLNLTAASNAFLLDPWWNPAVEEQAIMRIHRIGQLNKVTIKRFIVKGTVEERMLQVQARKQRMIAGALTDEEVRTARIEELKMLFR